MKRGGRQDAHTKSSSASTDGVVSSKREDKRSKRYQNPVSKSRDKSKGNKKLRFCDVSLNNRLVVYRIGGDDGRRGGGGGGGRGYSGVSATDFAAYLSDYRHDDSDDYEEEGERLVFQDCPPNPPIGGMLGWAGEEEDQQLLEDQEEEEIGDEVKEDDDDDDFGFFKVGIVVDYVVEEDWCVIGEM